MSSEEAPQIIRVGNHQITLPEGVSVSDWALERTAWQNPRIRGLLGCMRLLDGVLESNYAILHCSPERLLDIWKRVREVAAALREKIAPLLESPSCIPELEDARRGAQMSLKILDDQVLSQLDRVPEEVPPGRYVEVRKLLCVAIGQLHAFIQEAFGELMAKDPRSVHDADYFLSRRFPRDVEEAEWLHATVLRLQAYVGKLVEAQPVRLGEFADQMRSEQRVPEGPVWEEVRVYLNLLLTGLTEKLHEVLALRGIRFDELEVLDRYAREIPTKCRLVAELYAISDETISKLWSSVGQEPEAGEQSARDLEIFHRSMSRRIAALLGDLDGYVHDLAAFIPLWLTNIEKRRALLFRKERRDRSRAGEGRDEGRESGSQA